MTNSTIVLKASLLTLLLLNTVNGHSAVSDRDTGEAVEALILLGNSNYNSKDDLQDYDHQDQTRVDTPMIKEGTQHSVNSGVHSVKSTTAVPSIPAKHGRAIRREKVIAAYLEQEKTDNVGLTAFALQENIRYNGIT